MAQLVALFGTLYVDPAATREHSLDDDVEGRPHHFVRNVEFRSCRMCEPPVPRPLGRLNHCREEAPDALVPEDRRCCAPLPSPPSAVGGENSFAQRGPECTLQGLSLDERVGLFDQHLLDEVRLSDENRLAPEGT